MGVDVSKFLKKSIIKEMKENVGEQDTFVTAGAYMYCSYGTHEEVLNQLQSNGTYINNTAMMTVADCIVSTSEQDTFQGEIFYKPGPTIDGNLYSFGYCRSKRHPLNIVNQTGVQHISGKFDYDPDIELSLPAQEDRIFPCVPKWEYSTSFDATGPKIVFPQWQNGNEKVLINGVPALTNKSCMYCKYGGKIEFLSNGMEPVPGEFSDR